MGDNKRKMAVIVVEEDEDPDHLVIDLSLSLSLSRPLRKSKGAPSLSPSSSPSSALASSSVAPDPNFFQLLSPSSAPAHATAHQITDLVRSDPHSSNPEAAQRPQPSFNNNMDLPLSTTLSLSLSLSLSPPLPPPPASEGVARNFNINHMEAPPQRRRARRNPSNNSPRPGKSLTIPPPFPWSRELRATVVTMEELTRMPLISIEGQVQCKRCDVRVITSLQLSQRLSVVMRHVMDILTEGNNRAPAEWGAPKFPPCPSCMRGNCMRPVVAQKKRDINWLFMYLGETLGTCNLEQLKYFCKHNNMHRTGSKMHLLLYAYLGISKHLHPTGPFNVMM